MKFVQGDLSVCLSRVEYCMVNQKERKFEDDSDIKALELHIGFDCEDGWGSICENYICMDDVKKLIQGLSTVTNWQSDFFEFSIKTIYDQRDWMKFQLEYTGLKYHFRFEWRELEFNELYVIDQEYSQEEWKAYFDEFLLWGEEFPVQLGDRVIGIDPNEKDFKKGMEGRIETIYPRKTGEKEVDMMVSYIAEGWNGSLRAGKQQSLEQIQVLS